MKTILMGAQVKVHAAKAHMNMPTKGTIASQYLKTLYFGLEDLGHAGKAECQEMCFLIRLDNGHLIECYHSQFAVLVIDSDISK